MNSDQDTVGDEVLPVPGRQLVPDVPIERMIAAAPTPIRKIISTFRFEAQRTKTLARRSVWLLLALFPVAIMAFFRRHAEGVPAEAWGLVFYALVPQAVSLLGLLLWVSPVLSNELEARTWLYLAVRPGGKAVVLLGKYLNGVLWSMSAALFGLAFGVILVWQKLDVEFGDPLKFMLILAMLTVYSCITYGSLYLLLGVLFPQRSMVVCVAYTLVIEVIISMIPAIMNQLTVQHRLFNVLFLSMQWEFPEGFPLKLDTTPVWLHLAVLSLFTLLNLSIATWVVHFREYVTSEQN